MLPVDESQYLICDNGWCRTNAKSSVTACGNKEINSWRVWTNQDGALSWT
jgi:hypothetical protein